MYCASAVHGDASSVRREFAAFVFVNLEFLTAKADSPAIALGIRAIEPTVIRDSN